MFGGVGRGCLGAGIANVEVVSSVFIGDVLAVGGANVLVKSLFSNYLR